ncbi:MAG TPA: hypothetical protein VE621_03795 [Bryobacteraceae bacterium]|jgi:predicted ATP-grasp superfamily ATP-dependent carboligase|nr:hypothetical protein [Bryobacteraceae bacterium]
MSSAFALNRSPIVAEESTLNAGIPALILGSGLTATGVIRTLGRAGIPLFCVGYGSDWLKASRWFRPLPFRANSKPKPKDLVPFLESLPLERAVLVPCADDWLRAVGGLPRKLAARFPSSIAPSQAIETCVDKWQFAQMLKEEQVPHPQTRILESLDELESLPESSFTNSFLKPIASLEFGRRHKVKAFLIRDKPDAVNCMRTKAFPSDYPIMLQEYIPGPPTNHYFVDGFVDRYGFVQALFARQRLRMYPPWLGNSTLMETVGLESVAGAVESIERIVKAIKYRGIFSAEFKLDDRDGYFKILEINARPWWYVEFASRAKVDVCSMAYRDALELPVHPVHTYQRALRCVYLPKDFKAFRHERNGSSGLTSWISSWIGVEDAVFCWDDPGPALAYVTEFFRDNFGRKGNA